MLHLWARLDLGPCCMTELAKPIIVPVEFHWKSYVYTWTK